MDQNEDFNFYRLVTFTGENFNYIGIEGKAYEDFFDGVTKKQQAILEKHLIYSKKMKLPGALQSGFLLGSNKLAVGYQSISSRCTRSAMAAERCQVFRRRRIKSPWSQLNYRGRGFSTAKVA